MSLALNEFYTTSADPEEVFQEVRHTLSLHPELLNASPEQLACVLSLKAAVFDIAAALEALSHEGEVLA